MNDTEEHLPEFDSDAWVHRLKMGYEAGYYKTEVAEDDQTRFPWQNKTCKDCPFWFNSICRPRAEYRSPTAHTCGYFDPWYRERARDLMRKRRSQAFRRWWEWFNEQGRAR